MLGDSPGRLGSQFSGFLKDPAASLEGFMAFGATGFNPDQVLYLFAGHDPASASRPFQNLHVPERIRGGGRARGQAFADSGQGLSNGF